MQTSPEFSLGVAIANYLEARVVYDSAEERPGEFDAPEELALSQAGVNVATCAMNVSNDQEAIAALELVMLEGGFLDTMCEPLVRGVLAYLKRKQ
jgi:hypothetical protein